MKYDKKYLGMILEYMNVPMTTTETFQDKKGNTIEGEVANPPPTKYGFARLVGTTSTEVREWTKAIYKKGEKEGQLKYPEFAAAYEMLKDVQGDMIVSNSITGKYNARFAVFAAKNMIDWRDNLDQNINANVQNSGKLEVYLPDNGRK